MARRTKPSLDEDTLVALGARRLARLVIEQAHGNPSLRDKLDALLPGTNDAPDPPEDPSSRLTRSLERRIGTLENIDGYEDWRSAAALGADISAIRQDIIDDLLPNAPRMAAELLARLVDLQHTLFDMADDSDGELGNALFEVVDGWARAWTIIGDRDPEEIADIVFEAVQDNPYGVLDEVIPAFADALGDNGLKALAGRFRMKLDDLPTSKTSDDHSETDWARSRQYRGLQDIADIKGDVDAFIAAHEANGTHLVYVVEIAERLYRAGRPEDALRWIERPDGRAHPNNDSTDLHAAILIDLGRKDEAFSVIWRAFETTLSPDHFRTCFGMVPENERANLKTKAVAIAGCHENVHLALALMTEIDAAAEASVLVIQRAGAFNARAYWVLRPAAKAMTPEYPLAATVLYRLLAEGALRTGKTKYYPYGIRDLRQATLLSEDISDWQDLEEHELFMNRLRAEHGRKRTFWAQW